MNVWINKSIRSLEIRAKLAMLIANANANANANAKMLTIQNAKC